MKDFNFAIIDVETNFDAVAMSMGIIIVRSWNLQSINKQYYIFIPEKHRAAMYSHALYYEQPTFEGSRDEIIEIVKSKFTYYGVKDIFAYNAYFDYSHLKELKDFIWHDIMKVASNRNFNKKISDSAICYNSGKLKSGYSLENIFKLLSGNDLYKETHNALLDARDELRVMKYLGVSPSDYPIIYDNKV